MTTATNIHTGPSSSSDIIGAAHPSGEAVVASRQSDWVQIVDPVAGKTGWIKSASLAPSTEDAALTEAGRQGFEVPDGGARSATVEPKPRAKAKEVPVEATLWPPRDQTQVRIEALPMTGGSMLSRRIAESRRLELV